MRVDVINARRIPGPRGRNAARIAAAAPAPSGCGAVAWCASQLAPQPLRRARIFAPRRRAGLFGFEHEHRPRLRPGSCRRGRRQTDGSPPRPPAATNEIRPTSCATTNPPPPASITSASPRLDHFRRRRNGQRAGRTRRRHRQAGAEQTELIGDQIHDAKRIRESASGRGRILPRLMRAVRKRSLSKEPPTEQPSTTPARLRAVLEVDFCRVEWLRARRASRVDRCANRAAARRARSDRAALRRRELAVARRGKKRRAV